MKSPRPLRLSTAPFAGNAFRPPLTTPEPAFVPVDARCPSVLICDYTGKEVV
jgi:hypothetical protein